MKTTFIKLLTVLVPVFIILSCEKEINVTVPVIGVNLSDTALVIEVDSLASLLVNIEPQDASNKTLKWSSSDTTIAKVSSEGVIIGISPGTADILVETKDGYSEICKVNVIKLKSFDIYKEGVLPERLIMAFDNYDNLWYGEARGLYKLRADSPESKFYPLSPQVRAIDFDSKNNLWAATWSNGLLKFDGQTWSTFDTINSEIPSNKLTTVAIDDNDMVWVGLGNGKISGEGVARFDGANWETYNSEDGLVHDYVFTIMADQQNNIWFATRDGASMFDGSQWKSFLNDKDNTILIFGIDIDMENNIWFVTSGQGIFKYDGVNMNNYNTYNSNMYSYEIDGIGVDDKDNLWISYGGQMGIGKFNGTEWVYLTYDRFDIGHSKSIAIDSEGNKWVGNYQKIFKLMD